MIQEKTKINRVIHILQEKELTYARVADILHCSPKTVSRLVLREKIPVTENSKKITMIKSLRSFLEFIENNNYVDYILFWDEAFSIKEIYKIVLEFLPNFEISKLYSAHEMGSLKSLNSITKYVRIQFKSIFEYFRTLPELEGNARKAQRTLREALLLKKERNPFARPSKPVATTPISPPSSDQNIKQKIFPKDYYFIASLERSSDQNIENIKITENKITENKITENKITENKITENKMDIIKQKFFPKDYYPVSSLERQFGTSVTTIEEWVKNGDFKLSNCVDQTKFSRKINLLTSDILNFIKENNYEDYILTHHFHFLMSEVVNLYGKGLSTLYAKIKVGEIPTLHSPVRFRTISYKNLIKFFEEANYPYDKKVFQEAYETKKKVYQKFFGISVEDLFDRQLKLEKVEESIEKVNNPFIEALEIYKFEEIAKSLGICIMDLIEWVRIGYLTFEENKKVKGINFQQLKDFIKKNFKLVMESQLKKLGLMKDNVYGIQNVSNLLDIFPVDVRSFCSRGLIPFQTFSNSTGDDSSYLFQYSHIIGFSTNSEYQRIAPDQNQKLIDELLPLIQSEEEVPIDLSGVEKEKPSYTLAQCNEHLRDSVVNTLKNFEFTDVFDVDAQAQVNQYFSTVYDLTKKLEGVIK